MSVARARWRCGPRALAKQSQPAARTAGSCVRSPSVATMTMLNMRPDGQSSRPSTPAAPDPYPAGSLSTPDDWCALGPGEQGDGNTWRGSTPCQRSTPGAVCRPVGGGVCGFGSKQRTKGLDPAHHRSLRHVDSALGQQLHDACAGQWIPQVPTNDHKHHLCRPREVPRQRPQE
jgi:hypothetical protein